MEVRPTPAGEGSPPGIFSVTGAKNRQQRENVVAAVSKTARWPGPRMFRLILLELVFGMHTGLFIIITPDGIACHPKSFNGQHWTLWGPDRRSWNPAGHGDTDFLAEWGKLPLISGPHFEKAPHPTDTCR